MWVGVLPPSQPEVFLSYYKTYLDMTVLIPEVCLSYYNTHLDMTVLIPEV